MKWLFRALWLFYGKTYFMREVKRVGLKAYIRVLRMVRGALLAVVLAFIFFQMMVMALAGAVVSGFMLWDHDLQTKLEIFFWLCVAGFALPLILLMIVFSERFWIKMSGAQSLIDDLKRS